MKESAILELLQSVSLRPTLTRISILQFMAGPGAGTASAEDVFRQPIFRGRHVSLSTVYRTIHELESSGLLLREWGANRKALYRITPASFHGQPLRLVCRESGRSIALADPDLHAHLLAAARNEGFDLRGQVLDIAVDRLTQTPPSAPSPVAPAQPRTRAGAASGSAAGSARTS